MLFFGFFKKIPGAIKTAIKIVNHPKVRMGLDVATIFIPGSQVLKVKTVLDRVKIAEVALGPGKGLEKFNKVFAELQNDPLIENNKELNDLIEKAVMIVNGTVIALDDDGKKID